MNHDSANVVRGGQAHVFPGLATVERFVNSIAPRGTLAVVGLAAPDPDHGRIGRSDGNVADGRDAFLIEHRLPGCAVVGGFPDAAGGRAHVHDVGIDFDDCEVINAPAHHGGTNLAKFQILEFICRTLRRRC